MKNEMEAKKACKKKPETRANLKLFYLQESRIKQMFSGKGKSQINRKPRTRKLMSKYFFITHFFKLRSFHNALLILFKVKVNSKPIKSK